VSYTNEARRQAGLAGWQSVSNVFVHANTAYNRAGQACSPPAPECEEWTKSYDVTGDGLKAYTLFVSSSGSVSIDAPRHSDHQDYFVGNCQDWR
jgi:hypothetical protein